MTAPKVTLELIEQKIQSCKYEVIPDTTMTVCLLTMQNGFSLIGSSACASPENFDPVIGRKLAREDAVRKIWPLEGYLLRQRLHDVESIQVTEDRS